MYEAKGAATFNIKLTDCAFIGTGNELNMPVWGGHTPDGIDIKDYVTTDNSFTKEELQAVPAGLEGKWIETAEGVMPVVVADMLTECVYQATTATEGKYSIRLIGEIASLNYKSVDFKVKITRADGKSAYWNLKSTFWLYKCPIFFFKAEYYSTVGDVIIYLTILY